MKLNERGRGKFKPALDYNIEDVKKLLYKRIEEEKNFSKFSNEILAIEKMNYKEGKLNLISLFSGCGGLDLGFELAGLQAVIGEDDGLQAFKDKKIYNEKRNESVFHTIYANDNFNEATQSYLMNFNNEVYIDNNDIRKIKDFPSADIVLGGFPCPGFSEAGPRLIDDKRNFLYLHFIRCLFQSKPLIFVAENVRGMMTLGKGEVFRQIVQDFEAAGYTVFHKLLDSSDYGIPQIRKRVILVGVRKDLDFKYKFPEPTHGKDQNLKPIVSLRDAIWDLKEKPGDYFTGTYSTIFMSRNRKKSWDEPSYTIQASGRQAPIHPDGQAMRKVEKDKFIFSDGEENNRRFSIKEIARIQTFPDWFEFSKGNSNKKSHNAKLDIVYKQIGNAVPVMLARAVALPIAQWALQYINNKESDERSII